MSNNTENNKLIAEFMGLEYTKPYFKVEDESLMVVTEVKNGVISSMGYMFEPTELKYHTSWDWLMPVVSKILDITFSEEEKETSDSEHFYKIRDCIPNINYTYKAVVEFIKLYNKNKK